MGPTLIILGVIAVIALWVMGVYNNLIKLRNNRENAFANIDVQLKQRFDLIPELVGAVKGYAKHEKELLENLTLARSTGMSAKTIDEKIKADQMMSSALQGLRVTVEAYPELKANTNFMHLQTELADIENKLAAVRRFFNSATKEYNNAVEMFPGNIIAGMFGHHKESMFEIAPEQRAAHEATPKVEF